MEIDSNEDIDSCSVSWVPILLKVKILGLSLIGKESNHFVYFLEPWSAGPVNQLVRLFLLIRSGFLIACMQLGAYKG